MALQIAQLGQPVLRQPAEEILIDEIIGDDFQHFLKEMRQTLVERHGAGLAGPQVFASKRVFLARVLPSPNEDDLPGIEIFINPNITVQSEETELAWEGCLSFPELVVLVERHANITVEYYDEKGESQTRHCEGFAARVVQHEFDHLEGVLTIDRAPSPVYIIKESELDAFMEHHQQMTE